MPWNRTTRKDYKRDGRRYESDVTDKEWGESSCAVWWGDGPNFPDTSACRRAWRSPDRRPGSCTTSPKAALSSHWGGKTGPNLQ